MATPTPATAPRPVLVFAHGAGAPSTSDWMRRWAGLLSAVGDVRPFDYPYMQAGKRAPDRLPKLLAAHADELQRARASTSGPVVLIGKSMGSRVGCHLALEHPVDALVCLGYPLQSPGKSRKVRDQVLLDLATPVLFVQGTRDRLCPLDLMAEVRAKMTAPSELHIVDTGDHSLHITKTHTKRTGVTQEASDAEALAAITAFVAARV